MEKQVTLWHFYDELVQTKTSKKHFKNRGKNYSMEQAER